MFEKEINRRKILKNGLSGLGLALVSGSAHGMEEIIRGQMRFPLAVDGKNPAIQMNMNACNRCGGCRMICQEEMGIHRDGEGEEGKNCIYCGQCTLYCPSGARSEKYHYSYVTELLDKKDRIKVASIAPSLRVSIGEMYRKTPGSNLQRSLIHSLRSAGFDYILDLCFGADVTIMEESEELVRKIENNVKGPLFTSCCPSWTRFAEIFCPDMTKYISKVKSPMMMQGALVKTWFAKEKNIKPEKIDHVVFMPCTAKKYEMFNRGYESASKYWGKKEEFWDIDCALTTRETAYLLYERGIKDLKDGPDGEFDSVMGQSSGAGRIFGGTGGVMEAALRTAWLKINKNDPPKDLLHWKENQSLADFRTAEVDLGKKKIRVAMVHGISAVRRIVEEIRQNESTYDFVEVMVCPGGCVGGGGQPMFDGNTELEKLQMLRRKALFASDRGAKVQISGKNPEVIALYENFLKNEENDKKISSLLRYNS